MGRPGSILGQFRETVRCRDAGFGRFFHRNTGAGFVVLRTTACFLASGTVSDS